MTQSVTLERPRPPQAPPRSLPSPPAGPAGTIIGAAVGSVVATLGRLVALRERDV